MKSQSSVFKTHSVYRMISLPSTLSGVPQFKISLIYYPENRAQVFHPRGDRDKIGECRGIANCFLNRSSTVILPCQFHLPELPGATFEGLVRYTGLLLSSR